MTYQLTLTMQKLQGQILPQAFRLLMVSGFAYELYLL
jgi:hypothetical protein